MGTKLSLHVKMYLLSPVLEKQYQRDFYPLHHNVISTFRNTSGLFAVNRANIQCQKPFNNRGIQYGDKQSIRDSVPLHPIISAIIDLEYLNCLNWSRLISETALLILFNFLSILRYWVNFSVGTFLQFVNIICYQMHRQPKLSLWTIPWASQYGIEL